MGSSERRLIMANRFVKKKKDLTNSSIKVYDGSLNQMIKWNNRNGWLLLLFLNNLLHILTMHKLILHQIRDGIRSV